MEVLSVNSTFDYLQIHRKREPSNKDLFMSFFALIILWYAVICVVWLLSTAEFRELNYYA